MKQFFELPDGQKNALENCLSVFKLDKKEMNIDYFNISRQERDRHSFIVQE